MWLEDLSSRDWVAEGEVGSVRNRFPKTAYFPSQDLASDIAGTSPVCRYAIRQFGELYCNACRGIEWPWLPLLHSGDGVGETIAPRSK